MAEPQDKKSGWNSLQLAATIIGLLAFVLGVQSLGELKERLFPSPAPTRSSSSYPPAAVPSRSPTAAATPDRETVKWRYVQNADAACAKAQSGLPGATNAITYDWMTAVLTVRDRSFQAWTSVPWPVGKADPVYDAEVRKMWSDFAAGTDAWRQMRAALKARNSDRFNLYLADFTNSRNSFAERANRFGFRVCNNSFPTTSAWR